MTFRIYTERIQVPTSFAHSSPMQGHRRFLVSAHGLPGFSVSTHTRLGEEESLNYRRAGRLSELHYAQHIVGKDTL